MGPLAQHIASLYCTVFKMLDKIEGRAQRSVAKGVVISSLESVNYQLEDVTRSVRVRLVKIWLRKG